MDFGIECDRNSSLYVAIQFFLNIFLGILYGYELCFYEKVYLILIVVDDLDATVEKTDTETNTNRNNSENNESSNK